jgi:uncharacterized protein Usg
MGAQPPRGNDATPAIDPATEEFRLRLQGFRLTTANVLYYMPDHPKLIQSFTWQTLDLAPRFPRIQKFLSFWRAEICAVIHSIEIASAEGLAPARVRHARFDGHLQ